MIFFNIYIFIKSNKIFQIKFILITKIKNDHHSDIPTHDPKHEHPKRVHTHHTTNASANVCVPKKLL